jgi:hypothetical protein
MQNGRVPRSARAYHHSVYVVLLACDVLREPRFRRANPDYRPGKPCVYVGMTGLTPDERFDKHKAGHGTPNDPYLPSPGEAPERDASAQPREARAPLAARSVRRVGR